MVISDSFVRVDLFLFATPVRDFVGYRNPQPRDPADRKVTLTLGELDAGDRLCRVSPARSYEPVSLGSFMFSPFRILDAVGIQKALHGSFVGHRTMATRGVRIFRRNVPAFGSEKTEPGVVLPQRTNKRLNARRKPSRLGSRLSKRFEHEIRRLRV